MIMIGSYGQMRDLFIDSNYIKYIFAVKKFDLISKFDTNFYTTAE